jgi:hypothetical protein
MQITFDSKKGCLKTCRSTMALHAGKPAWSTVEKPFYDGMPM